MSDERPRIEQGCKVYVFTGTEDIEICGEIWTRDRYDNANGDPRSFLLVNFVNTHRRGNSSAKPQPIVSKKKNINIRNYIQDWKRNSAS